MKKWMYIIFPGAGLGLFMILYFSEVKKMDEKDRAHAAEMAATKKADDERKARLQLEANESAAKQAKQREDERQRKEAEKAAKWKEEGDKIQADTNKAKAEAAMHQKKIDELQAELADLRAKRDQANREYMDLVKSVELAKVDRRNAELEIQRMTQMVANRAADSSLTRMPAPVVQATPTP